MECKAKSTSCFVTREWQQRRDASKSNQQLKVKTSPNKGKQPQNSVVPQARGPRECPKCGRSHPGECLYGKNVCFWCKTPGHMSQDCPQRKMKGLANSNGPPTGRVYTLNAKKAKGNNDLIAGKKCSDHMLKK
uniref:Uncharacterized protein LOC113787747 n=1 Tax=Cicer arietinum TaxID=3827 RepID=A0A3Q7XGN4_CICAR|nr:uncharacterized protein LOC113787747 [Cicer arietinum]